jgi:hypothetical protein
MLFTPDDQLRNMLSAQVGEALKMGPNASPLDNVAQIVSLQGLLGNQPTTPVPNSFLNDDWLDDDFSF